MTKHFTFNRVSVTVGNTSSYGRYKVIAHYRGKDITAYTEYSYSYDFCDSEEPDGITTKQAHERMMSARRSFLQVIKNEYNNTK